MPATPRTPGRRHVPLRRRARYAFDNTLSAGSTAMVAWLGLLSLVLVLVAAAVVVVLDVRQIGDPTPFGFIEAMWASLMRTLDPGTMGGDTGWGFRFVMLGVTIGGILVVATLIGVVASGIETRLDELRKGRSVVVESDHTLILGWSPEIFGMIVELSHAKVHHHRPRVVIVADRDKVEMEDEIRTTLGDLGRLKVVCRTGNPLVPGDIALGNPDEARAIIVLAPPGPGGDEHVVKTLLAIVNSPHRQAEPYHIVAELRDPRDLRLAAIVAKDEAELIATDTVIAHITAQTSRQPGLSAVYTELLDFSGDELYFGRVPDLVGRTFGDALLAYDRTSPIGLRAADGSVKLVPPGDTVIAAADEILAIAADSRSVAVKPLTENLVDEARIVKRSSPMPSADHTLVLNWNARAPLMLAELDDAAAAGSTVHVVADDPTIADEVGGVGEGLLMTTLAFQVANPTEREVLEPLIMENPFQHVVILSTDSEDAQESDTHALVTLLHVRDIMERCGRRLSIVTEILDRQNRELARVTAADDFIVSEEVISRLVTQVSQTRDLHGVLTGLFRADVHIEMHGAADYVQLGQPVTYATVVESARRRGEIAIGYRLLADAADPDRDHGVVVNPAKSSVVTFAEGDRVVAMVP